MDVLKLIWKDIKIIGEGLLHFPVNLLLLGLGIIKALLSDTQTQLVATLGLVVGLTYGVSLGFIVFLSVYSVLFFLSGILKLIVSRSHNQ